MRSGAWLRVATGPTKPRAQLRKSPLMRLECEVKGSDVQCSCRLFGTNPIATVVTEWLVDNAGHTEEEKRNSIIAQPDPLDFSHARH